MTRLIVTERFLVLGMSGRRGAWYRMRLKDAWWPSRSKLNNCMVAVSHRYITTVALVLRVGQMARNMQAGLVR